MPSVIALASQKGGVGKTTTCLNLGAALASLGKEVLLVDLDPQGALTAGCDKEALSRERNVYTILMSRHLIRDVRQHVAYTSCLDLLPANIDLAGAEVELASELGREYLLRDKLKEGDATLYDYILIDCPPSLGLLTINALTAANKVLIPVACQYLAYRGMQQLMRTVQKVKARLNPTLEIAGILPTLYTRTRHAEEVLDALQSDYSDLTLDMVIPTRIALADAMGLHKTIFQHEPKGEVAARFMELAEAIDAKE